jgi:hypothetical protein
MARLIPKQYKGMGIKTSVKSGNFRATKSGAGMTAKGVAAYRKANPGSKLKTAVTGEQPICGGCQASEVFLRPLCWSDEEVSRGSKRPKQPDSSG